MSGEIAAGKSAVASELEEQCRYQRIRSGNHLAGLAEDRGLSTDRQGLQRMGDLLDQETKGGWIANLAQKQIADRKDISRWVLDSARRDFQVLRFRELFGAEVIHVHLTADESELKARFHARAPGDNRDSGADYAQVKASETEKHAKSLGAVADIVANSGTFTPNEIARLIDLAVTLRSGGLTV